MSGPDYKLQWETSEKWRKAYQDAKERMYSAGAEIAEFAINHMPCNESQVDSWFRREYIHRGASAELLAALEVMIQSAHPHPTEHPTMTAAWKIARAAIAKAKGEA